MLRSLPRSISINPIRAAGTGRSRLASSEKLRIFLAPFRRSGNMHRRKTRPTFSIICACRR
jgi:hypothetical protein